MPLIIGVAGAIATGKSSACKILEKLGATHCDADKLVHTLYEPGKPAFDRIVETFGDEVVGDDGSIDRRILGAKVFGKPEEMQKLSKAIGNIAEAAKKVIDGWKAAMGPHDVAHTGRSDRSDDCTCVGRVARMDGTCGSNSA